MNDATESARPARSRYLNPNSVRTNGADYVLCWLQQTLRGVENPVIDEAVRLGNSLGLPVVVYHGLGQHYPHASRRLHQFILEASLSLEADVSARGLSFLRYVERDSKPEPGLVYRLAERAAAVVVDDHSAYVARWQAQRVADRLAISVRAVDGCRLVPESAIGTPCKTTPAFRKRLNAVRATYLDESLGLQSDSPAYEGELATVHDSIDTADAAAGASGVTLESILAMCNIDTTVPAVAQWPGDRPAALKQLAFVVKEVLPHYASRRNDPSVTGTSGLSPWLHFGVLGPHEVARAVVHSDMTSRDRWKFLDELLVWREYFHHLAVHRQDPTSYANVSNGARKSLAAHAGDPRPQQYSLRELICGDTSDDVWNASQKQFLIDGWMHNNLRMYWGKKLLEWTDSPESAWQTGCYLNDRFSLDGRDPATYGNLAWCFGGGKPWAEVPIYGWVARKGDSAIRRRTGDEWLREQATRQIPDVSIPDTLPTHEQPQASGRTDSTQPSSIR